jgi:gluconokinase
VNSEAPKRPAVLIFMGVAGSGKTTVAKLFAKKTGAIFYEGDDFHPPENVAKMRGGIPLTDADRERWLQTLMKIAVRALAKKEFAVLTCSALKAKYRAELAADDARVKFVHLTGPRTLIEERLKKRRGHFMPPALLASQFAILEPPADALVFSCTKSPEKIVAELVHVLGIAVSG